MANHQMIKFQRYHTPRYIFNRIRYWLYCRTHSDYPWLTPEVNRFLEGHLNKNSVGLEFGSGRSTIWFARRMGRLISVEHNAGWYEKIQQTLKKRGLNNVELHHCPEAEDFVQVGARLPNESLDFVLVDGGPRSWCANIAVAKG
jgi:predicted O-methyltransferase YrrM